MRRNLDGTKVVKHLSQSVGYLRMTRFERCKSLTIWAYVKRRSMLWGSTKLYKNKVSANFCPGAVQR